MNGIQNEANNGKMDNPDEDPRNVRVILPFEDELQPNKTENDKANVDDVDEVRKAQKTGTYSLKIQKFRERHKGAINILLIALLNVIILGYFVWAIVHFLYLRDTNYEQTWPPPSENGNNDEDIGRCPGYCGIQWCDGHGMLIILFVIVYVYLFYFQIVKRYWGKRIYRTVIAPVSTRISMMFSYRLSKLALVAIFLACVAAFIAVDTQESRSRLQGLAGIFVLFAIGWLFSKDRRNISYQPVICGFACQFLLGVFCIRWEIGRSIFRCIGDKVSTFLLYSYEGAEFVYGNFLVQSQGVFAFAVLPVIFFVSLIISILYYWGAMQWIVLKLGWILQSLLGTTVCESVTCSANIFLGMSESPLLIRPYIKILTHSEIHAIMASGFATVSGSVLAAYISYGAEPAHLITSSVMAAPAALCFSKLFYPETEESKTKSNNMVMEKSQDSSVLDAASAGATVGISLVLGIAANLVAFVAFVAFLNGAVNWLGYLVGYSDLTFESIFSKLFIPLAWIIGIPWDDCENVARVIATKTIINEFVAYERLGKMKEENLISLRSSAIATYAVCGFANPSSLGIMIASLSAMAPERRASITAVAFRAFVSGSIICFITASIAGMLIPEDSY